MLPLPLEETLMDLFHIISSLSDSQDQHLEDLHTAKRWRHGPRTTCGALGNYCGMQNSANTPLYIKLALPFSLQTANTKRLQLSMKSTRV